MTELVARNAKVEFAPMKDETVLFNPANNKFCVLNATAAYVWQALERPQTAREIAENVAKRYRDVDLGQAEQDVERALAELRRIDCVITAG